MTQASAHSAQRLEAGPGREKETPLARVPWFDRSSSSSAHKFDRSQIIKPKQATNTITKTMLTSGIVLVLGALLQTKPGAVSTVVLSSFRVRLQGPSPIWIFLEDSSSTRRTARMPSRERSLMEKRKPFLSFLTNSQTKSSRDRKNSKRLLESKEDWV